MIIQLVTAEPAPKIHVTVGYFLVILLLVRVIWGFTGTKHARFSDFIYPPGDILDYLKGLFNRNPKHYIGHNPAGGAMVCRLLFIMLLVTMAGLKALGEKGHGPFAKLSASNVGLVFADSDHDHDEKAAEEEGRHHGANVQFWKEIHETSVGFLIFLVVPHIGGVITSSYVHHEDLILLMITGKKPVREDQ